MFVKATNDVVDQYPYTVGDLRRDNPNVSFPKTVPITTMAQYNMFPVSIDPIPPFDPDTQKVETPVEPTLINGAWHLISAVVDLTPEEKAALDEKKKAANKTQAESLLQQTDWVELGDVSDPANPPYLTNKTEFTTYRAALRTIAVNPPVTVSEWPVKPDEQWSN